MISCKLIGRLGNQMFQIASAYGYAVQNGMSFMLPARTESLKVWPHYFKGSLFNKYDDRFRHVFTRVYQEPSHSYTPIPKFNLITLSGYFQSYMYFDFCRGDLIRLFQFDRIPTKDNYVSLHVRRGDYLLYPDKHPVVTLQYIEQAIRKFDDKQRMIILFSDDYEWCNNNLTEEFFSQFAHKHFVKFGSSDDPLADVRLMSMCEHNIISNSSFSWWGAYLNKNPNKVVVTPSEDNWFGTANKHLDVSTLLPKDWIRIKY